MKQNKRAVEIENGRVRKAYEMVKEIVEKKSETEKKEYKSYVRKIPSMILTNGVGPTIAFIFSKSGTYGDIYEQIENYLKSDVPLKFNLNKNEKLIDRITRLNSTEYKLLTEEVLELFSWLKKFAEGMIEVDDDEK